MISVLKSITDHTLLLSLSFLFYMTTNEILHQFSDFIKDGSPQFLQYINNKLYFLKTTSKDFPKDWFISE